MAYLQGYVKIIIFQNKENGYVIAKVKVKDTDTDIDTSSLVTVTGYFPVLHTGDYYKFLGEVTVHNKYGEQFKAEGFESIVNESSEGLVQYLSSDLFYGVGPKLATKMVETFGDTVIDQILDNPEILLTIGIKERKMREIHRALETNQGLGKILSELYDFGFGSRLAMMIYQKYYNSSVAMIKEDPYILVRDFKQISFERADKIAFELGFLETSELRLNALLVYILEKMMMSGDTVFDTEVIINEVNSTLSEKLEGVYILELLKIHESIFYNDDICMLQEIHDAEVSISECINNFNVLPEIRKDIDFIINDVNDRFNFDYSDEQVLAIKQVLEKPFSVITGGPGTGKTTVLKGIIESYKKVYEMYDDRKIVLVSPTGRAAKRMSETTNYKASTIHSFLGYDFKGEFTYNKDKKLGPKLLVIDESSMIDTLLMQNLLEALKSDVRVVMLGDVDQLPSVGAGQVLADILNSDVVPTTRLTKIFRQSSDSHLIPLAYGINNGEIDEEWIGNDVRFIECNPNHISETVQKVVSAIADKEQDLESVQVLAPMYKGTAGIDQINYDLQQLLNPEGTGYEHLSRVFKVNDKVLQLVNQPENGIMNGDIGTVISTRDKITVDFDGNLVSYSKSDLINLKHAYCISIHKSQGNEYSTVILPIAMKYRIMLSRKLLYTAITRAKQYLIFVGERKALDFAITQNVEPRVTLLKERIQELWTNS